MKSEKLFHFLVTFLIAIFTISVITFAVSWAARLLSKEEMAAIHGGCAPVAVAKAEGVSDMATMLKRQLVHFDGTESTGDNLTYGWTFGDGGTSSDSMPTHRYTSTGTYTATLTVTNAYGSDNDSVTVRVILPGIVKVEFAGSGEHTVKYENDSSIVDPIWDTTLVGSYKTLDANDKNEPAAYTRASKPTVKGKTWVEYNLTTSVSILLDTTGTGVNFDACGGSIQNGISSNFVLPASTGAGDKFHNYIYEYDPFSLQWKYKISGDNTWVDTDTTNPSNHVVYLTYGAPKDSARKSRLEKAVKYGSNGNQTTGSSLSAIRSNVQSYLHNNQNFVAATGQDGENGVWNIVDPGGSNNQGDCIAHANLMKVSLRMLGIDASYAFVADATNQPSESSPSYTTYDCAVHGSQSERRYLRHGGTWWNFEGVCGSGGTYYDVASSTSSGSYDYLKGVGHGIVDEWDYVYWDNSLQSWVTCPYH